LADTRTLTTIGQDVEEFSPTLRGLSIRPGLPIFGAISDASCHLGEALSVLSEIAAGNPDIGIYAVLTAAAVAKALIDSAAGAIELADREATHD